MRSQHVGFPEFQTRLGMELGSWDVLLGLKSGLRFWVRVLGFSVRDPRCYRCLNVPA